MPSHKINNIQDLPLEILELICENLCYHCVPSYGINLWKPSCECLSWEARQELRTGLASLATASRRLSRVARPFLWHQLETFEPGPEARDELLSYIRFFDKERGLRSAVKSLVVDGRDQRCTCCPRYEYDLTPEERRLMKKVAKEQGLMIMIDGWDFDKSVETIIQLLISMLPALQELHLKVPRTWTFDSLQVWRYQGVDLGGSPKKFLRSAKRIEFDNEFPENTQCCPEHSGCNRPTPKSPVEQILIESAPRLEILSCTAGGLDSRPFLRHLKYLELQPRGYWGNIRSLFAQFPKLTHLRYCTSNEHSPSPRNLQDALEPLWHTLEVLNISIQRFMTRPSFGSYDDWEPPFDNEWTLKTLKKFTSLKSLTVDSGMIWHRGGRQGKRVFSDRDSNKMADFLPSSIETVFVDDLWGDVGPMFPLARSVASGLYPRLKTVLWYEVDSSGEVIMTLDKKGESDWLSDNRWKSVLCDDKSIKHIQSVHPLSDGHLMAFPDWEGLYQAHCQKHDELATEQQSLVT